MVTPATGLEERMMPLINCRGEIMKAALAPTVKAASGIIGAKLKNEALPDRELELSAFDSSPAMWGNTVAGTEVRNPAELTELHPDLVLISNYNFSQEIYDQLKPLQDKGIRVECLHRDTDVPWVF